jgi:hypothetical protein
MSSFLDPRMKGGVESSDADKEIIYDNIRESIIEIAAEEIGHPHEQQQQPAEGQTLHKNATTTCCRRQEIQQKWRSNKQINQAATKQREITILLPQMIYKRKQSGIPQISRSNSLIHLVMCFAFPNNINSHHMTGQALLQLTRLLFTDVTSCYKMPLNKIDHQFGLGIDFVCFLVPFLHSLS